jgi:hypothetical protein
MSINRSALRIATVLALRGRTNAGEAVFDSRNDALEDVALGESVPVISVYTEEDKTEDRRRSIDLVIEFAVNTRVAIDESDVIAAPQTDEALELTLDVLEAQIIDALMPAASPAADLLASLAVDISVRSSKRGVLDHGKDRRLAARQLLLRCGVVTEPVAGAPVPHHLTRLIALMQADPFYAPAAAGLAIFISRSFAWTPSEREMSFLMLDRWSARAIGMAAEETKMLSEIVINGESVT